MSAYNDEEEDRLEQSGMEKYGEDWFLSDREIQLEILRLTRETHAAMLGTQTLVQGVVAEVGPMVESFANNPMLKTLGFGPKLFGKRQ